MSWLLLLASCASAPPPAYIPVGANTLISGVEVSREGLDPDSIEQLISEVRYYMDTTHSGWNRRMPAVLGEGGFAEFEKPDPLSGSSIPVDFKQFSKKYWIICFSSDAASAQQPSWWVFVDQNTMKIAGSMPFDRPAPLDKVSGFWPG